MRTERGIVDELPIPGNLAAGGETAPDDRERPARADPRAMAAGARAARPGPLATRSLAAHAAGLPRRPAGARALGWRSAAVAGRARPARGAPLRRAPLAPGLGAEHLRSQAGRGAGAVQHAARARPDRAE